MLAQMTHQLLLGTAMMFCGELHAEERVMVDPTKPPSEVLARTSGESESSSNVVLSGIKQDGKASFAILNDTFVRVGEVFKGYRLLSVNQSHVILEDEAKQKLKLTLSLGDFKKSTINGSVPEKTNKWQKKSHKAKND